MRVPQWGRIVGLIGMALLLLFVWWELLASRVHTVIGLFGALAVPLVVGLIALHEWSTHRNSKR